MTLLHVIAPAPYGGLESVVQTLALARVQAGRPVMVAALLQNDDPHPIVERLRAGGVPVIEVRCGRRRYLAEVRALADLIREKAVSLVHSHNYHPNAVGLLAARRCRVPIVATVHGFSDGSLKDRVYDWVDHWLLRRFDRVIFVSDALRDRALRAGSDPDKVIVIQNGHVPQPLASRREARAALGLPEDVRVVGWVGRLSPVKGPDLLVDAVAYLATADACVAVVGDGPERGRMLERQAALGISPQRLRLVGSRKDVARLFSAFDVFVMTSRNEGTPIALLEAMAAGVPVVSFAVGGIPGILDNASSWLVAPGDAAALASAMADALTRPAEGAARAKKARETLNERFGVDQWVARIEEVYLRARGLSGEARTSA